MRNQATEIPMPDIPAEKILAFIDELRAAQRIAVVHRAWVANRLQKMVDDEDAAIDAYYEKMAVDAYYEKMAEEAEELADGRLIMEDAALERSMASLSRLLRKIEP